MPHLFWKIEKKISRSPHPKVSKLVDQIPCAYWCIRNINRSNPYPIVYSSWKLNKAERNYSTTEREALGMVFSLQKYRHYLLANPFTFYTNHQALKYFVSKPLHHGRICRWLLLFQEFEFEVVVRPGKLNLGPNHLSRIDTGEEPTGFNNDLPNAHLFHIEVVPKELE